MKSALSAGLVAALLCPTAVIAGSTCPKTARGSHRVTCFSEIDYTEVHEEGHDHHHKRSHKKKLETTRTISLHSWSFFWNWVAKDDCPKTTAHLSTILPLLANTHHGVRCTVEVGWTPEHGSSQNGAIEQPHGASGNQSHGQWGYAGHGQIDSLSLPAKMEWPLHASFERPDQFTGSGELGAKYEVANHGDVNKLEIHSGHGNDFAHSWSHDVHLRLGEYSEHGDHHNEGHNEFGGIGGFGKRSHKDKEVPRTYVGKDHRKFGGHYNTKTLHSCWVFEKYHVSSRQVTPEKKKHHGHHKGHLDEIVAAPVIPFHQPDWSICEPQIFPPAPCEEECHGDSCGSKKEDCKGDSCELKQNNCHQESCNENPKVVDDCNTSSCGDKKKEENSCHSSSCEHVANDRNNEACKPQSCHDDSGSDNDSDSDSDDDCERDCGDNSDSDDGSDDGSESDGGSKCEKACRSMGGH